MGGSCATLPWAVPRYIRAVAAFAEGEAMSDRTFRMVLAVCFIALLFASGCSIHTTRIALQPVVDSIVVEKCKEACAMKAEPDRTDLEKKNIKFCVRHNYCKLEME